MVTALTTTWTPAAAGAEPVVGRFALDRFEPTPAGDRFLAVPSGGVDGALALRGGISLDYARNPLVLRGEDGDALGSVVSDKLLAHFGVSLALWDQVLLSLSVPAAVVNTGDDPGDARTAAASPSGPSLGDVRLGVRVQLLGTPGSPAELGLGTYLWLPSGDPAEYTGDEGVRSMPHLALGGIVGSFVYAAFFGLTIRESVEVLDIGVGTELGGGAAAGALLVRRRLLLGAALVGGTAVAGSAHGESVGAFDAGTTYAELHACGRMQLGDFAIAAAAGPGLSRGVGTPALRAVAAFEYIADPAARPQPTKYGANDRKAGR